MHDASPQLNVIQRVGNPLGTAVIAVVLQTKLAALSAHGRVATPAAIAQAFDETYRWVVLMLVVALIPATVLWRVERRLRWRDKRPTLPTSPWWRPSCDDR